MALQAALASDERIAGFLALAIGTCSNAKCAAMAVCFLSELPNIQNALQPGAC